MSLADEKFSGKVIIITIAGTWCPNCNDEARFMAPFYRQYRDRGLEVVALMFEHFEDTQRATQQIVDFAASLILSTRCCSRASPRKLSRPKRCLH